MSLLGRRPVLSQADLEACRTLLKGGSKSFHAASRLLPRRVCEPAAALYAFCRVADDAIDLDGSLGALALLHRRLDAIYAGQPMDTPADRALLLSDFGRLPELLSAERPSTYGTLNIPGGGSGDREPAQPELF